MVSNSFQVGATCKRRPSNSMQWSLESRRAEDLALTNPTKQVSRFRTLIAGSGDEAIRVQANHRVLRRLPLIFSTATCHQSADDDPREDFPGKHGILTDFPSPPGESARR